MDWVDYARGLAIILVVFRHSLAGMDRSGLEVPAALWNIQEFVFNFRMPVFFMLSGIFLARSLEKKPAGELVRNKAYTLLYPYVLWAVIFISIQIALSGVTNAQRTPRDFLYIITQPRNLDHMWYLLALFNTSLLLIALAPLLLRRPALHLAAGFGLHMVSFLVKDYSLFSDLLYHYIFLVIGTVITKQLFAQKEEVPGKDLRTLLLLTPVFIAGQLAWLHLRPGNLQMQALFLVITLVACTFFYFACRVGYRAGLFRGLVYLGRHSIYIYILHLLVISSFRIVSLRLLDLRNVYVLAAASLVLGIAVPLVIYELGKKRGIRYLFTLEPERKPNG
jgi:fucose 4-O-acetylase-like acetyltransferase